MRIAIGLSALLAAAACAPAQVTLSTVIQGVSTPVDSGSVVPFGSVAAGWDNLDLAFRIGYTGSESTYYLTYFNLQQGTPFSVVSSDWKSLPAVIPAGGLNFTVRFKPNIIADFSATMAVGESSNVVYLFGKATQGLTVLANNQTIPAGRPIPFGSVQVGSTQALTATLSNQTGAPLAIGPISLAGSAFQVTGGPPAGATVPAGSSANLQLAFNPPTAGPQQGNLLIGSYPIPLTGTGLPAPPPVYPTPAIQVALPSPASALQGSVSVALPAASASSGGGTLVMTFQSAVAGASDDPSIVFSDGSRSVPFTVAQGASQGSFADGQSIAFGTGTTAGAITFTATLGDHTVQSQLVIPAAIAGIDAAVAARNVACAPADVYCTTANIELQVNGWDNTRSASQLVFTFFDSAGNQIAPGNIAVSAASSFEQYFVGSELGGVFGLHALFPVSGDASRVAAAEIEIINAVGTAQTTRITF